MKKDFIGQNWANSNSNFCLFTWLKKVPDHLIWFHIKPLNIRNYTFDPAINIDNKAAIYKSTTNF